MAGESFYCSNYLNGDSKNLRSIENSTSTAKLFSLTGHSLNVSGEKIFNRFVHRFFESETLTIDEKKYILRFILNKYAPTVEDYKLGLSVAQDLFENKVGEEIVLKSIIKFRIRLYETRILGVDELLIAKKFIEIYMKLHPQSEVPIDLKKTINRLFSYKGLRA